MKVILFQDLTPYLRLEVDVEVHVLEKLDRSARAGVQLDGSLLSSTDQDGFAEGVGGVARDLLWDGLPALGHSEDWFLRFHENE